MRNWKQFVRRRLGAVKWDPERKARVIDDLAQMLEDCEREALLSGADEQEARAAAEAQVPDWEALSGEIENVEASHEGGSWFRWVTLAGRWRSRMLSGLGNDFRLSLRTVRRNPVFSLVTVLTLALAIG
ncbi:MAG TPA: hypothetical protein VLV83_05535, partial [Acidobacteriota bacterium]|nr:hypothetical protein [Acidobacteriota bacterium]